MAERLKSSWGKENNMDNKLLTVDEVSKIIQIHPMTIRLWLREGRIKGTRLGRVWRISEEQLEEIKKGD